MQLRENSQLKAENVYKSLIYKEGMGLIYYKLLIYPRFSCKSILVF